MKKSLLVLMLSSFLIIGISTNAACMNTDERGYISVNATSMQEIASDTVEISITIETDDTKSLQNATLENKQISVHPNENNATVYLAADDLVELLRMHGNRVEYIELEK